MDFEKLMATQRQFYASKVTLSYTFRVEQLNKLLQLIKTNEAAISAALFADLHKSNFEAWGTEIGVTISELEYFIRHLKKWMRPKRLRTPLFHFRANGYIQNIPHGNTLIVAPWNYPFLLSIRPLIGAIAAGNTAIVKPSENAPATALILEQIINANFDTGFVYVVNTDIEGSKKLTAQKFDYLFYTGGTAVGKIIYEAAAKHLTPVALELGGKNPCIIDETANIEVSAARITWGKFNNSGQTCVASDYLIVHESIKEKLINALISNIEKFYGENPLKSPDYGRIINPFHFNRVSSLLDGEKIIYGGKVDANEKYISPTLVEITNLNSPLMESEIFGPILPIISYKNLEEALAIVNQHPNPLVFYIFTKNMALAKQLGREISCGDMVINETVLHFGDIMMPIGGKGDSGFGKTQGKYSYEAFSHQKSVLSKRYFPDLPVRYPPYNQRQLNQLKVLFRFLFQR